MATDSETHTNLVEDLRLLCRFKIPRPAAGLITAARDGPKNRAPRGDFRTEAKTITQNQRVPDWNGTPIPPVYTPGKKPHSNPECRVVLRCSRIVQQGGQMTVERQRRRTAKV
jgi:hypothetical protein